MRSLQNICLLLLAAVVLGLGIQAATGLTGKDEYLLGLRIPLEMIQGDHWWVPFIDGEPRLKKPPFLYWLGRASYEFFGPSLLAGRGITVAFALLLLGCTAWLGKKLGSSWRSGLLAAGVLLGMAGLATESRRLMLDVPVAALSTAAFCAYWSWLERPRWTALLGASALLSAALLTKGPIALVACGSGMLALWLVYPGLGREAVARWGSHLFAGALALVMPLVWFLYVKNHYAALLAKVTQDELEARHVAQISADPLIGILTLALPWSFLALCVLWKQRSRKDVQFLGWWLAISLLPFFFINSFSRYLIGSLPAVALVTVLALEQKRITWWPRFLGSLIPLALCGVLVALLWRWQSGGWQALAVAMAAFLIFWWRPNPTAQSVVLSAAVLWMITWGIAFPRLGVNAVAPEFVAATQGRAVVLFAGPQPALLPILQQRPLRQTSQLTAELAKPGTLIALRAEDQHAMETQLQSLKRKARPVLAYHALTSAGSGVRFAKDGATRADWQQAWDSRSPQPLMSTVQLWEVQP